MCRRFTGHHPSLYRESRHGYPATSIILPKRFRIWNKRCTRKHLKGCPARLPIFAATGWMPEAVLIRFVRHAELDEVTGAMTRLEMLAKYGDLSEFSAELNRIKNLLHHIYDSEIPYLRNIF